MPLYTKYNYMFLTKPYKFILSLNGKTSQKATKTTSSRSFISAFLSTDQFAASKHYKLAFNAVVLLRNKNKYSNSSPEQSAEFIKLAAACNNEPDDRDAIQSG